MARRNYTDAQLLTVTGAAAPVAPWVPAASEAGTALSEVKAVPLIADPLVDGMASVAPVWGAADPLVKVPGLDMLLVIASAIVGIDGCQVYEGIIRGKEKLLHARLSEQCQV